ncbi:ATP synthase subunit I [Candidatus Atelocyanobacterium thalassae]|uniref:Bacterial ATP synthase I n=1 Tax=Atelocyanobacterium thalassa (isolate ALOHA) TaxID=1453429 RepID=D3EN41_ATETH|nr:ATP synthase subunit I [Candidatus Atelocyanobacterium thalassa]ADB94891.1 Bacterial ATP synthase I [Candidatus Atelocyanobacterium thalassa isolate ALOHA]MCH2542956.1 ATP synthase subunit I [Candidatus Atelocyanobacterium sp. ALOHA_A2.5_9]|tara:strand:+ start:1842 stop:2261 length:420 start_codon:yes stop_codon:yes gene_type:complete
MQSTRSISQASDTETIQTDFMKDYYQLQRTLMLLSIVLTIIIFTCVWIFHSLLLALNYLLGALVGIVYLKILAKEVEKVGTSQQKLGKKGLILIAAMIIVASQWQKLYIVPVFLGFLTYKIAIIAYTIQNVMVPAQKSD